MRDPKTLMFAEACAMLKQAEQLHRQFFEPSRESARAAHRTVQPAPLAARELQNGCLVLTFTKTG